MVLLWSGPWPSISLFVAPSSAAVATSHQSMGSNITLSNYGSPRLLNSHHRRLNDNTFLSAQNTRKLIAPDAASFDYFGNAVGISGSYLVVGAPGDDDAGFASGSAYIYRTIDGGATWDFVEKIVAPDAAVNFGDALDVEGDYIAVGAQGDSINAGSVYVYGTSDSGATWDFMHKIVAPDADAYDTFGQAVALSANLIVIGAGGDDDSASNAGSAYIYRTSDDGATWDSVQKLVASDAAAGDLFGQSVAMNGDYIVVGADRDDDGGADSGAVYIFRKTHADSRWVQVRKLIAADAGPDAFFGRSVAMEGNVVVVGTELSTVYVFVLSEGRWIQAQKIVPRDLSKSLLRVAISGNIIVIGAYSDDDASQNSGSVYIYETPTLGETWDFVQKIGAPDAAQDDWFGFAVAIHNKLIVVGAHGNDDTGTRSGSAYTYHLLTCAYMTMADSAGDGACSRSRSQLPEYVGKRNRLWSILCISIAAQVGTVRSMHSGMLSQETSSRRAPWLTALADRTTFV